MARVKLSEARLARLLPRNRRYDVWDSEAPGLIVQVTTTGHRSYMLCRRFPGKPNPTRRLIAEVGAVELEDARSIARDWTAQVRRGIDPAVERRREEADARTVQTFRQLGEEYIRKRVPALRRRQATEREVRQLIERWGRASVADVTRADVVKFLEEWGVRSPSMAHRLFGHLRALFNWARERGDVENSPCDRIRPGKLVAPAEPRQRTLTDAELRAFWIATGQLPYPHGPLHRLVLLTGARLREVADAEWSEFDLEERVWRVPPERNKSRAMHLVPLSDAAMALLKSLPHWKRCRFLFTADRKSPVRNMHTPKARIDAEMAKVLGNRPEPWVVHDLRRVIRSNLAAMGVREEIAERVLGHGARNKLVRTYDTYQYLPEVREALERWGRAVGKLVP